MATQTFEQLIAGANKIKENELPESNTHDLIGEQLLQMTNKMREISLVEASEAAEEAKRAAEEAKEMADIASQSGELAQYAKEQGDYAKSAGDKVTNEVLFKTAQSLTEEEQAQVKRNIGVTIPFSGLQLLDWPEGKEGVAVIDSSNGYMTSPNIPKSSYVICNINIDTDSKDKVLFVCPNSTSNGLPFYTETTENYTVRIEGKVTEVNSDTMCIECYLQNNKTNTVTLRCNNLYYPTDFSNDLFKGQFNTPEELDRILGKKGAYAFVGNPRHLYDWDNGWNDRGEFVTDIDTVLNETSEKAIANKTVTAKFSELEKELENYIAIPNLDGLNWEDGKYWAENAVQSLSQFTLSDYIIVTSRFDYTYIGGVYYGATIGFFDENKEYLSELDTSVFATSGGTPDAPLTTFDFTVPQNARYMRCSCLKSYKGDFNILYKEHVENEREIVTKEIIVAIDGSGDFTSIDAALKSITDADEYNRYVLHVKNGIYNEIAVTNSNYSGFNPEVIQIIGEDKAKTILNADGLRTDNSPSDYFLPQYANMPYNKIPSSYKECITARASATWKNLTIQANNCRYPIHMDYYGDNTIVFDNCNIISNSPMAGIGIGLRTNQSVYIRECFFSGIPTGCSPHIVSSYGVYAHNVKDWHSCKMVVEDCVFDNVGIMCVDENGSKGLFDVTAKNCVSNSKFRGISLITGNNQEESMQTIRMNIVNCKHSMFYFRPNRIPSLKTFDVSHQIQVHNAGSEQISMGDCVVCIYGSEDTYQAVKKATGNTFDFVALSNIPQGENGFADLCNGHFTVKKDADSVYTTGEEVDIENGIIKPKIGGRYIYTDVDLYNENNILVLKKN